MPRYNYKSLSSAQLREYARDLERICSRITEISEWMDASKISTISARNSAIGVRAMDYAKKYGDALEEAVLTIKTESEVYAPSMESEDPARRSYRKLDEARAIKEPDDREKLLAMFQYVMENLKDQKSEEPSEEPSDDRLPESMNKKIAKRRKLRAKR